MIMSELISSVLKRRVSWRTYGMHGEKRRPMIHRHPCNAPSTVLDIVAENVSNGNALYKQLTRKGK